MKKVLKWTLLTLGAVLLLAVLGFVAWGLTPLGPGQTALAALTPDARVAVTTDPWLTFTPADGQPTTGFIFYPGGRVDYRSYAPLARMIASNGYLVVIPPMPLSLAVMNPNAANAVIAAHPEIAHWAIGGHSLGGVMAAQYAYIHPDAVEALIFFAAYPASNADLSNSGLQVLSLYGSRDNVLNRGSLTDSRPLLPADSQFMQIDGGNHAQFGDYGSQPGDNPAEISPEDQWNLAARAIVLFLGGLEK